MSYATRTASMISCSRSLSRAAISPAVRIIKSPLCILNLHRLLPLLGNVADIFCDPRVGINCVDVSFAAIRKNRLAVRAFRNRGFHSTNSSNHGTRRSAREERFTPHELVTMDHTIDICNVDTVVSNGCLKERRAHSSSMTGYQTLGLFLSAKDDAP